MCFSPLSDLGLLSPNRRTISFTILNCKNRPLNVNHKAQPISIIVNTYDHSTSLTEAIILLIHSILFRLEPMRHCILSYAKIAKVEGRKPNLFEFSAETHLILCKDIERLILDRRTNFSCLSIRFQSHLKQKKSEYCHTTP